MDEVLSRAGGEGEGRGELGDEEEEVLVETGEVGWGEGWGEVVSILGETEVVDIGEVFGASV